MMRIQGVEIDAQERIRKSAPVNCKLGIHTELRHRHIRTGMVEICANCDTVLAVIED